MRCFITVEGKLRIEAETETEGYALRMWYGESCETPGKNEIECSPRHTLTLGPQPLHLMAAGDYVPPMPPPVDELRTVYSFVKDQGVDAPGTVIDEAINVMHDWLEPMITNVDTEIDDSQ